ncbi:MAG: D-galactosyl-beta-1-4-L-rhamnose phosphorylase, partial [Clostridiales bacterium]|nr:D-galactosyl-beta-1-4-L-rhamnose phosphorylase [Clostridiales bacterium]
MADAGFTMPGEAGYEELCLALAEKWNADMIRDSDGTQLSEPLLNSNLGVYSTICPIRGHNEWLKNHLECSQQTFLCSKPVLAEASDLKIELLHGFFKDQFEINEKSQKFWQVFDRTEELEVKSWSYDPEKQTVSISDITPWHQYTVSFFAWRVWEEISMYNHTTNNWTSEKLMQLDPIYPEAREYLVSWLTRWCEEHHNTAEYGFTTRFYKY